MILNPYRYATAAGAPTADVLWLDAHTGLNLHLDTVDRMNTWEDQTASGFDMSTQSNGTGLQDPIVDTGFGCYTLDSVTIPRFAVDDFCFRNSAVLSPQQGSQTIYMLLRDVNAAVGKVLVGDGNSTDNNPIYSVRLDDVSGNDAAYFMRGDTGSIYADDNPTNVDITTPTGWFTYAMTDDGSEMTGYVDGSAPSDANNPLSYTFSGSTTCDRFAIGGLLRSTMGVEMEGFHLAEMRVYSSAHSGSTVTDVHDDILANWGL